MAKSFIDVVQDPPRTGVGIPVKTKNPLSRTNTPPVEPPFGFKLRGQLLEYILSKKYRELVNKTQVIYYSSKFILSLSRYAPPEILYLCQRIIQSSKRF